MIDISSFKENSNLIAFTISDLINVCFSSGIFPNVFKKAIVWPLFKKGDKFSIHNYRPISKLPTLSKIIEKCIKARLLSFFTLNGTLSSVQFGFRPGLSTQDALIHVTEKFYSNLHDCLSTIGVYIDFSKAFDTLNRNILIRKLQMYGIRGLALKLLSSYLENRSQQVFIGESVSNTLPINLGIPQGSVLGPLLFLIYVNEVPNISNNFTTCMFADDTSFLFKGRCITELFNVCNRGLEMFSDWCIANRLSVNIHKTKFMVFSNRSIPAILPNLFLNGAPLDRVSSIRFLGIELDHNLKFDLHINNIANKISKINGIIYKMRGNFPRYILTKLYFSLIEPHLNYCSIIFGNSYQNHLDSLEIAQRKCVRTIFGANFLAHPNPIFLQLKILKFKDIYKLALGSHLYKNHNLISEFSLHHGYDTRNRNYLIPQFQRLTQTQHQSVNVQAPIIWNLIPSNIKICNNIKLFKKKFKEHLKSFIYSP